MRHDGPPAVLDVSVPTGDSFPVPPAATISKARPLDGRRPAKTPVLEPLACGGPVLDAAFAPHGRTRHSVPDGSARSWTSRRGNLAPRPLEAPRRGHPRRVQQRRVGPPPPPHRRHDQRDRSVKLWEIPAGRQSWPSSTAIPTSSKPVAFRPDGRELATGGVDGTMKRLGPADELSRSCFDRGTRAGSILLAIRRRIVDASSLNRRGSSLQADTPKSGTLGPEKLDLGLSRQGTRRTPRLRANDGKG